MKIKRLPKKIELKLVRDFGSIVRQMRQECGLSQAELATEIGLKSATAISLYESNKREISAVHLWRIASICGYELKLDVNK